MNKKRSRSSSDIDVGRVKAFRRGQSGNWTLRYYNGRCTVRRSLGRVNKQQAEIAAADLNSQLTRGDLPEVTAKRTLQAAVEEYLTAKTADGLRKKSLVKYSGLLRNLIDFCHDHGAIRLDAVTSALFDRYRAHRVKEGRAPKTLAFETMQSKTFFNWCVEKDFLTKNPLRSCKVAPPPQVEYLTPTVDQVNRLIAAAELQAAKPGASYLQCILPTLLAVSAFSGLRIGEVVALRPVDVDLEGGWLGVVNRSDFLTKNGTNRKVPMHPRLMTVLTNYGRNFRTGPDQFFRGPVCPEHPKGGQRLNYRTINAHLATLSRGLGILTGRKERGLVIHGLRHFFRTEAAKAAVDNSYADNWMGHSHGNAVRATYIRIEDETSQKLMRTLPFQKPETIATPTTVPTALIATNNMTTPTTVSESEPQPHEDAA